MDDDRDHERGRMTHDTALGLISINARNYRDREPTLGTLLAEVSEFARALEGKHDDPPALELVQIGGIVLNLLRGYDAFETMAATQNRDLRLEGWRPISQPPELLYDDVWVRLRNGRTEQGYWDGAYWFSRSGPPSSLVATHWKPMEDEAV